MDAQNLPNAKAIFEQPFLTIAETCQLLKVSKSTVYRLIAKGQLRASKLSYHVTVIRKEDILAMLENNPYAINEREAAKAARSPKVIKKDKAAKAKKQPTTAADFNQSVKNTFIESDQCDEPCYTLADVCRIYGYTYGRFYNFRMRYQIPTIKAEGTKCFPKSLVDRAMAEEEARLGNDLAKDWYTCFDLMKLYGIGKTQVRRFAETHGVRIKKCGKNNHYLKADWDAAREKAREKKKCTKAKRK